VHQHPTLKHSVFGYYGQGSKNSISRKFVITKILCNNLLPQYSKQANGVILHYYWSGDNLSPIYFDHKIAGPESTFNYIYFGLIPHRPLTKEDLLGDCCPIHTKKRIQLCKELPSRQTINKLSQILIDNWEQLTR